MAQNTAQKDSTAARLSAYVRGVRSEGRKVTWPTRAETLATSGAVAVMVVVAGTFLFTADQIMAWGVRHILSLGI